MNPVKITETVLRDSHQSLIATRMTIDEILPSLELLDKVGYHAMEVWGGATFDACLRFLNEDPWERLRKIRAGAPNTKLQMLFRGQNILGYRHYADDVVEYFVQKSLANGIDIIRIFDALNDPRNLDTAVKATIKEGGHVQAAFSYTTSPVHTTESFVQFAKEMENRGANSICIKDMAGLLTPYNAYELVKALKESVRIPIELHTHCTAGIAENLLLCTDSVTCVNLMCSSRKIFENFKGIGFVLRFTYNLSVNYNNRIGTYYKNIVFVVFKTVNSLSSRYFGYSSVGSHSLVYSFVDIRRLTYKFTTEVFQYFPSSR